MRAVFVIALLLGACLVRQSTYDKKVAENKQLQSDLDAAHKNEQTLNDKI